MNNIYVTYEKELKDFLTYEKGIRYLIKGLNDNTLKRFFVYERNEQFNKALNEWLTRNK